MPTKSLPECFNKKCMNDGFIGMGGHWYCGECVLKWHKYQQDMVQSQMEDALNGN